MKEEKGTARDRILEALAENPNGLSKAALERYASINPGAFRRVYRSMLDTRQIVAVEEQHPQWGPWLAHRLPASVSTHEGQERFKDAGEPPHAV